MNISMTIFKQELKMSRTSIISWSIAVAVILLIFISLFGSIAKDAALFSQLMANYPPQLLDAFGMNGVDFTSILGLFGVAFIFAQVCLSIQAANYGFGLVSVEERELTADFLLTKPVGRRQILTSKLLAALVGLTITNAVVWISSLVFINIFKENQTYPIGPLLLLLLSIGVFQLFFLAVGLVISLLVKRIRSVTPYAMALAFGLYVLSVFGDMLGSNPLETITPFKQFDPKYILHNGTYDAPLALFSILIIVVCLVASYALYTRRDIPSVV